MTGGWEKFVDRWLEELSQLSKKWPSRLQETLSEYANTLAREAFDPHQLMELLRRSGASFSGFAGTPDRSEADPYRILGLDSRASDEEVKKRFHDLAHKLHPDTAGVGGTECFFKMVLAAYEAIKRARGWQ